MSKPFSKFTPSLEVKLTRRLSRMLEKFSWPHRGRGPHHHSAWRSQDFEYAPRHRRHDLSNHHIIGDDQTMSRGSDIIKVLAVYGITSTLEDFDDLVAALGNLCDDAREEGHSDGYSKGYDGGVADTAPDRDQMEDEVRTEFERDLITFANLAKLDPQSAAVYFHRATGKHLFEVQQPCLL
jgi:hypothetical protein